jgi:hypothetical protein
MDLTCHPDRTLSERCESNGEWRDLLFVLVSNHAARSDNAANFQTSKLRQPNRRFPGGNSCSSP